MSSTRTKTKTKTGTKSKPEIKKPKKSAKLNHEYMDFIGRVAQSFDGGEVYLLSGYGRASIDSWVSTGVPSLDGIMSGSDGVGVGGFPAGRLTEIAGAESSGKTTLVLNAAKRAQEMGFMVVFVDAEYALLMNWCSAIGLDPKRMIVAELETVEDMFRFYRTIDRQRIAGRRFFFVLDSVAAMQTKADLKEEIKQDKAREWKDGQPANLARALSRGLKSMTKLAARRGDVLVFVNQIRDKMGMMAFAGAKDTPGGRALKFHASVRLFLTKIKTLKKTKGKKTVVVGSRLKAVCVKNKLGPPMQTSTLEIYFGGEVVDVNGR